MISARKMYKSVRYAGRGIAVVFKHEHSFRVQVAAVAVLVALIAFLRVRATDAVVLILVAMFVLVLELINSILERFIDIVEPRVGMHVRDLKDIMAGAVLIASCGAAVIGLIILVPYLRIT